MSIAMERFGLSEQLPKSRASSGLRSAECPYRLQCRACGFEPVDAIASPLRCPKCAGSAWERFAFPRSLLMHAHQHSDDSPALRSSIARADAI